MKMRTFFKAAAVATAAVMVWATAALADPWDVDNDVVAPGNQNELSFTVAPGAPVSTSGQIVIEYQGNKHLAANTAVTFQKDTAATTLPASATMANISIAVPDPWNGTAGFNSDGRIKGSGAISFTAPSTPGVYDYVAKWEILSRTCAPFTGGGDCLTGGSALNISVTVEAPVCANEYTVTFLPPFDTSNPSLAVINKAKAGRVVPVKAKVYDECAQAFLTDPSAPPSIQVSKTLNPAGSTGDPIETYADAGNSNGSDKYFRWSTDGFWIYNLDTKALQLVTGNTYRIDVFAGAASALATDDEWALLQTVK